MTIPSQASKEEGVETRRAAPHVGEGIVQTTNTSVVAKAIVVRNPQVQGSSPCGPTILLQGTPLC